MNKFDLLQTLQFAKGHYKKYVLRDGSNYFDMLRECIKADGYEYLTSLTSIRELLVCRLQTYLNREDLINMMLKDIHPQKDAIVMSILGRSAEHEETVKKWDLDEQVIHFVLQKFWEAPLNKLGLTKADCDAIPKLNFAEYYEDFENLND